MSKLKMAFAVILAVASVTGAGVTAAHAGAVASVRPIQSLTQLAASTNPSNYGLPDTIAGYKVFAVLPADTVACSRPGIKTLILQASQASVEDFLKAIDRVALDAALHQAGLTADEVGIQVVGPTMTLEGVLSEIQKWNEDRKKHGCVTSAPAGDGTCACYSGSHSHMERSGERQIIVVK